MKLLFIHDIKALLLDNNVFARSYGPTIWKRYLYTFSDILVCTRSQNGTPQLINGIDKLNGANVKFDSRIGMFRGPEVFFSRRIKNILREDIKDADGIIIRLDSFLGLIAEKECRKQRKPYVIEVVGCAWDSFWNHGVAGKVLAPIMFLMMKKAVKKAQYTIYVTKEFLQRRYPTTGLSTNISNVSLPTADETILKNRILKIRQTDLMSSLHIMTTANVGVRYKGFQYVIKALGLIKKKYNRCNLIYHVVGEGDQSYLRNIAKKSEVSENIVFHGAMSNSGVFDLLKDIDIYIQPSLQEGLPRAMIEAMSCAVPCIGTDVAGIPELINDKFIYKRGRNMPQEIARLLLAFDLNTLEQEAINNFEKAKDYDSQTLNSRRNEFLKKYTESLNLVK